MKSLLQAIAKSLTTTMIFFVVAEVTLRGAYGIRNSFVQRIPLPYALGDEYGPIPPWLERMMILVPDDHLIWRTLPNVHRTYIDIFSPVWRAEDRTELLRRFTPMVPDEFRSNPTWTIDLNSQGYRSPEAAIRKPPSTVRIACIGDSWTFGMNVDRERTYPERLAARLHEAAPGTTYEVLNFGVLGYSSYQGLELLKSRVLALHPDIIAIGFGMNDSGVSGYRDRDLSGPPPSFPVRASETLQDMELYKLLHYIAERIKFHPKPLGNYLKKEASKAPADLDYSTMEPWTRVSPTDYEGNLREMIRLSTASGAKVVLLDNELWDGSPYRPVLRRVAADTHVPLVDSLHLIADARTAVVHGIEARSHLEPSRAEAGSSMQADGSTTTTIFRVFRGNAAVPLAMSIVGNDPQLGNFVPNTILMRDDGLDGDERSGDGVWSYRAVFPAGTRIIYVYTNSGGRGRWEGLDVPYIRDVAIPRSQDGKPVYLPVETFGRVYMQADSWHTDAAGYDLIARAVADSIRPSDR